MKYSVIGVVIALLTLLVEVGLLLSGHEEVAGICLVFGIMAGGIFRFLEEMKGDG